MRVLKSNCIVDWKAITRLGREGLGKCCFYQKKKLIINFRILTWFFYVIFLFELKFYNLYLVKVDLTYLRGYNPYFDNRLLEEKIIICSSLKNYVLLVLSSYFRSCLKI